MPQLAEQSTMQIINAQMGGMNGDERLLVRFTVRPLKNEERTTLEGRPCFDDVEWIEIMIPGNRDQVIDRPLREEDKERFARQYAHYKAGASTDGITGTPLSAWPLISRSQVEELGFFHIKTVEQLANVSDGNAQKFMGINDLRSKAKAFLEAAAGNAPLLKMQAALDERDARIAALEDSINEIRKNQQGKKG